MKVENEIKEGKAVLALGEVTGHSHRTLQVCKYVENEEGLAEKLVLEQPTELFHETHDTIMMPAEEGTVIRETEKDLMNETRRVMD